MHRNNIALLRKEALRLIKVELQTLNEVSNVPGLLEQPEGTLTAELIRSQVNVLNSETAKLDSLDMVLAVVGTMKAGKSTTINALVGCEVVPNRNEAMTSVPTLIRHKVGQREPVLHFQTCRQVNAFVQSIRSQMQERTFAEKVAHICSKREGLDSVREFLCTDQPFNETYAGQDAIFGLLKLLNDLVRLSVELGVTFPFAEFSSIENFPVVEVEFRALRGREEADARFCLLDTPGPNEAGQEHLKPMLQDQLAKASAVLVVLNYSQLKTEADAELRAEIQGIAEHAKGRIFALVNRIDEQGANDPDTQTSLDSIAKHLLHGAVEREHIHAVSAKCAFLAGLTERMLNADDPEVAFRSCKWRDDIIRFGDMGRKARNGPVTSADLKEAVDGLWQVSLFEEGIEDIIRSAHANAASIAVESAASKLDDFARKISNFIGGRAQALKTSTETLQNMIEQLQSEIQAVEKMRTRIETNIEGSTQAFRGYMLEALRGPIQKAGEELDAIFMENQKEVEEVIRKINSQELPLQERKYLALAHGLNPRKIFDAPAFALGIATNKRKVEFGDIDLGQDEIEFSTRQKRDVFVSKVEAFYTSCIELAANNVSVHIDESIEKLDLSINQGVGESITVILKNITEQFDKAGFSLIFSTPQVDPRDAFIVQKHNVDDLVFSQPKDRIRLCDQDSAWGAVKRFFAKPFDAEWGMDEVSYTTEHFRVRPAEIKASLQNALTETFNKWQEDAEKNLFAPIYENARAHAGKISEALEAVAADLLAGIDDHSRSKQSQDALFNSLSLYQQPAEDLAVDAAGLLSESKTFKVEA